MDDAPRRARGERFEARRRRSGPKRERPAAPGARGGAARGGARESRSRCTTSFKTVGADRGAARAAASRRPWSTAAHLREPGKALTDGRTGALIAIGNTAAVVGFGAVAKRAAGVPAAVESVISLPGDGLVGAAIAVTLIAGDDGLRLRRPGDRAADPRAALPRAGRRPSSCTASSRSRRAGSTRCRTTATWSRRSAAICGETHSEAYWPLFA